MVKRWMMILLLATALAGCSRSVTPTLTPVVTAPPAGAGSHVGTVTASGKVMPVHEVDLSFTLPGRIQAVAVTRGDQVQAGDALVTLETDLLEANVAQAEAALAEAHARLALLKAGPRPGEIAAAEAQLEAARAAVSEAEAQRNQLVEGGAQADIASALAALASAKSEHRQANNLHDLTLTCVDFTLPGEDEETTICPLLGETEEHARYALNTAQDMLEVAQIQWDAVENQTEAQIRAANAGVQAAVAQRDTAQAQLDMLQSGATAEMIAAAEAGVAQAEAALHGVQAALEQATLRAPFAGTVVAVEVNPGEMVQPGQAALTLADLSLMQVETTDLSEQDVGRVQVGQRAAVYVDALAAELDGRVVHIASRAGEVGGDVVYKVVIELDEQPPGLRWEMSADIEIAAE